MIELRRSHIDIFDTTLRDGEQAGHQMSPDTKLAIAHRLADIGVNVIEAGFPSSSPTDFGAVEAIAREVRDPIITSLARIVPGDIEPAWRAIEHAARPRIHVFASTSPIHMEKKLRMTPDEVLARTGEAVRLAKSYCDDVEFSPEDATRTEPEFLATIVKLAIAEGAQVINIPDTVGYIVPHMFARLLNNLLARVPELDPNHGTRTLSVHCHNDLGNAVANTLVGVMYGARQVEGCFVGIGERAGNVALEQVIMNIKIHGQDGDYYSGFETGIDTTQLVPLCQFISGAIGYPIPLHQSIIGDGVFMHSSGIHADGVRKDAGTYEIMSPASVGHGTAKPKLVTHMGRGGIAGYLEGLGYKDGDSLAVEIYPHFIALAGVKGELTAEDMHMLVQEVHARDEALRSNLFHFPDVYSIDFRPNWARVRIKRNEDVFYGVSNGRDGVVSAVMLSIQNALHAHGVSIAHNITLDDYRVEKGGGGPEANAWTIVKLRHGDNIGMARAGDTDVVVASAKAYLAAINNLIHHPFTINS
ncbi:MAG: 2-isopropylmalate synthase [bacterium]|nr:2-isopropylmalate synthase [bacterium]